MTPFRSESALPSGRHRAAPAAPAGASAADAGSVSSHIVTPSRPPAAGNDPLRPITGTQIRLTRATQLSVDGGKHRCAMLLNSASCMFVSLLEPK